jgi:MFS family permease
MFLFYGQAGAVIISFFLVAYKVNIDETYLRIEETKGDAAKPGSFAAVFRDRTFLFLVLMMGLEFVVYSQTTTTLPLVMTAQGYPTWKYSLILTLNGGMLCLLQVPAARLLTRQHRGLIFVCCLVLEGIGFGMQAFADYYWIYIVAAITWTLGELGSHPAAQSIVPDIAPVRLRGRYQGVYSMSWSIAMIVSPTLGGLVLNAWGPKVLWLMGGLILFVVSLMSVANNKRIERSVNALWEQQMSFMQRS